jgi:hypothetical protein
MGRPWAPQTADNRHERRKPCSRRARLERTTGFEPATLTLAKKKEMELLRLAGLRPLSSLCPAGSSAQSAESAPLRPHTFSALNLYQLARGTAEPSREDPRRVGGSPVDPIRCRSRALRAHAGCRSFLTLRQPHRRRSGRRSVRCDTERPPPSERPLSGAAIAALRRESYGTRRRWRPRISGTSRAGECWSKVREMVDTGYREARLPRRRPVATPVTPGIVP